MGARLNVWLKKWINIRFRVIHRARTGFPEQGFRCRVVEIGRKHILQFSQALSAGGFAELDLGVPMLPPED